MLNFFTQISLNNKQSFDDEKYASNKLLA